MEAWSISPNSSLGPLELGASLGDCEALVGGASASFKRVPDSPETVFVYDSQALHITVGANEAVVELSAFPPRQVSLAGVQLLKRPLEEVAESLRIAGLATMRIEAGLHCPSAGVVLVESEGLVDGAELRRAG